MTALPDALTVRIMRWALANGWRQQWAGWTSPDRTTAVHPHRNNITGLVVIYRRDNATDPWDTYAGGPWRELAVRSVQEAADWLVLCEVLPVEFSSAYQAARKAAARDVQNMSHELGDEGWEEMCRRAEKEGYDREVVLRRRRGDFTTTNVEAAYQVGRDFAARIAAGEQP